MFRRRKDHSIPELNTTSTADISFMLLIFFLVTTSMETEKGLSRKLPPQNDSQKKEKHDVLASKVATLTITADGHILSEGEPITDTQLEDHLAEFVEKIGPEHIIEIKGEQGATYNTYFHLQNILSHVYGSLRDDYAMKHYHTAFADCTDAQRKLIRDKYPQHLSEELVNATQETK